MIKALSLMVIIMLFPVNGGSETDVNTDQLMNRVDVETRSASNTKEQWKKSVSRRRTPVVETEIIVTADPNGDAIRCTRYSDGRLTKCVRIESRDDGAGELREQVRIASRSIGIPGLRVQTRPQSQALINIETMLSAEADAFERTVNLLGQDVTIRAVPSRFEWHHGDGTSQTTRSPGRPNASSDVKYIYRQPAVGLRLSVDTTWTIHYRIAGGSWQELDETLTVPGPTTRLTTREARPILVTP